MIDLIKTLAVLTVLLLLLRRRIFIGTVMMIGSLLLAVLYLTPPFDFLRGAYRAVIAPRALEMTFTLIFTMIMENILRKTGTLKRMVESLSEILRDARYIMAAMPAMIGLLPSLGGAVFSAPMVGEAAADLPLKAEQKAFVNYWFRHIWEYVSPLYPGIILVAGLTQVPFQKLYLANAPYAISVVVWGWIFGFAGTGRGTLPRQSSLGLRQAALTFIRTIAPIVVTLLLVVLFRVNPVIALGGMTILLYLLHRYTPGEIGVSLRESVSFKMLLLVFGVVIFQETLRVSGALDGVSRFFAMSGLPAMLIISVIPFLAGLMTGLTIAFVGITFPILLPLMGGTPPDLGLLALAFGAGFCGVMLSPLHLCLVLTGEYFGADVALIYRRLWFPSALVLAAAIVPLWLF